MIAALLAAQVAGAAQAAELVDTAAPAAQRQGAFAGARFRIPLDGAGARNARAGLTLAPMVQGRRADGSIGTRFAEGMELRLSGEAGPRLALGGRSLSDIRTGPDGRKVGISTLGWVAIGVGVALVAVVAAGVTCQETNCLGSE
jgi:hypothetical protein